MYYVLHIFWGGKVSDLIKQSDAIARRTNQFDTYFDEDLPSYQKRWFCKLTPVGQMGWSWVRGRSGFALAESVALSKVEQ